MLSAVSLCRYSPGSVYAARPGEPASFPGAALGGMDAFRGQFPGPGQLVLLPLRNGIGAFQKPSLSVPVSVTPGEMKAVSPVTFMTETSWRDLPTGV